MKVAIEKLVREKSKDDTGFELLISEYKENIISFSRDNYHLFINLKYISLQMSIKIEENSVFCLIFIDPILVKDQNKGDFITFINHINWLTIGFGHFYVDTNNDIAYAIRIPEYMILNHIDEVRAELFEIPIRFYTDMQIPLSKLANGDWDVEIAIQYVNELYNNGYAFNKDYRI